MLKTSCLPYIICKKLSFLCGRLQFVIGIRGCTTKFHQKWLAQITSEISNSRMTSLVSYSRCYTTLISPSDSISSKSPRAMAAAQSALLEYLHSTRGLQFLDAEHMAKHSPIFTSKLLTKAANEEDISKALSRFFRYHPINEFEPFFESLGLKPAEFAPLLPRDLLFLCDDEVLYDNYHVLCNYGIARGKIGRIYREAPEVFRFGPGILLSKLQEYETLGLSKSSIIKLVASSPAVLLGLKNEFCKLFVELVEMGIDTDWIGKNVSEKDVYNWGRMIELLNLFAKLGFGRQELAGIICSQPCLILENSGKTTLKVVGLLSKLGATREDIFNLFSSFPRVQVGRFWRNLHKGLQFLIEIKMDHDDIRKLVRDHADILGSYALKSPSSIYTYLNIGSKRLCKIIKDDPHQLRSYALGTKLSRLPNSGSDEKSLMQKKEFLVRIGFTMGSKEMNKALKVFRGKGDQLQDRYDCLVKIGLDAEDVTHMVKLAPHILNQKSDVLEHKVDFLVNALCYPLDSLRAFPSYMSYTVERVKLRFLMYNWLKERGKARPGLALSSFLACSDKIFIKRFVRAHREGPEVWEKYKTAIYSS